MSTKAIVEGVLWLKPPGLGEPATALLYPARADDRHSVRREVVAHIVFVGGVDVVYLDDMGLEQAAFDHLLADCLNGKISRVIVVDRPGYPTYGAYLPTLQKAMSLHGGNIMSVMFGPIPEPLGSPAACVDQAASSVVGERRLH